MVYSQRNEWTILAGCVLETHPLQFTVIALGTGVKCIPYERMSAHGDVLNDCHAEVLCRRGVRTWLLDRLLAEKTSSNSMIDGVPRIFRVADDTDAPVRFTLQKHIYLHFNISTLPCTYPFRLTPGGEASSMALRARHMLEDGESSVASHSVQIPRLIRGRIRTDISTNTCILRTKPGALYCLM